MITPSTPVPMSRSDLDFDRLKPDYARLWATMEIRGNWRAALKESADKIYSNKGRYEAVAEMANVPWWFIGLVHQMEAGGKFACHLHNGDPLAARTVHVPANRPRTGQGPFTWEVSACDALLMKGLNAVTGWNIERVLYELERYNGFGYRRFHPGTLTPYLWSGTKHYVSGKYVADGKWDGNAVSGQSGAAALLKTLQDIDATILAPIVEVAEAPAPAPVPEETAPESFRKTEEPADRVKVMKQASRKWSLVSFLKWIVGIPTAAQGVQQAVDTSAIPPIDIPAIQGQLDAVQNVLGSLGRLGWLGWGLVLFVGLGLLQKYMVQDAADGRAVPSGAADGA